MNTIKRINELMEVWNVPGLALGIIRDGEVLFSKGYGKRNEKEEMNDATVLPIGSATKSFTALVLASLVEEGKLSWDTPIKNYIPWLKLSDPIVTQKITVRDCLCHRTGLPSYDVHGVFCTKDDRKQMIHDLKYLEFNEDFRSKLQYSNQMVMLAGYVGEVVSGKSYEELVTTRILEPLGMNDTYLTIADMEKIDNRAKGYVFNGQENIELPYLSLKGIGPAGAINSTVKDMLKYLQFQLGDGSPIVSKASMDEMHKAQMLGTPYFWQMAEIQESNYGLCWFVDCYRGKRMLSHGGNTLGFSALMTLLPEENLGIIVLTNSNSNFMIYDLTYRLLDEFLNIDEQDWTIKMQQNLAPLMEGMMQSAKLKHENKLSQTHLSHPIENYSGTYNNPGFGSFQLKIENNQLVGTFNGYDLLLSHYHYDVYDVTLTLMGLSFLIKFETDFSGKISSLYAQLEPTVQPIRFDKE